MSRSTRRPPRARTNVAHLPRRPSVPFARVLPTRRSVALGLALAVVAAAAYAGARESSLFAVRTVTVEGVDPALAARVRRALRPIEGESLLSVRFDDVSRLATALPDVESISYDRAFPDTLRVRVEAEQPAAVVRRGSESWLVSRTGRVMRTLRRGALAGLPRVWLPRSAELELGRTIGADAGQAEVAALAPARAAGLGERIATVRIERGSVVYVLREGTELRAGDAERLPLKLTVARTILATAAVHGYLDVTVPERPVAPGNPQVSS